MKKYEAPILLDDTLEDDTMLASVSGGASDDDPDSGGGPKNGTLAECWGYNIVPGKVEDGEHICLGAAYPGT